MLMMVLAAMVSSNTTAAPSMIKLGEEDKKFRVPNFRKRVRVVKILDYEF